MAEAREFVKAWQESSSIAEVAAKTRTKKAACRMRARRYRERGIPLKEFPPPEYMTTEEFWDDLTQYAASLLPPDESEPDQADEADSEGP